MPECNECGETYPASQGRWIEWEHLTGRTHAKSSGTRTGNGNSSSFSRGGGYRFGHSNSRSQSSRSTTRDHTRIDRIFVCNDCKAPKNYGWLKNRLVGWAIVAFIVYIAGQWVLEKFEASSFSRGVGSSHVATTKPLISNEDDSSLTVAEPVREIAPAKPKVVFAAPKEVVQDVGQTSQRPLAKCSATVTDHCSE